MFGPGSLAWLSTSEGIWALELSPRGKAECVEARVFACHWCLSLPSAQLALWPPFPEQPQRPPVRAVLAPLVELMPFSAEGSYVRLVAVRKSTVPHPWIWLAFPGPLGPLAVLTLFLESDDLCVRAEAIPGCTVVDGLEVSTHNVANGQRGDDALLGAHGLHCVAPRCP